MEHWNRPEKLWWWEPRWSFRPRLRQEIGCLLRPALWVRVAALTVMLAASLTWLVRQVPGVGLGWPEAAGYALLSFGSMVALFGTVFAIQYWLPPMITLRSRGLSRQAGGAIRWTPAAEFRSLTVDGSDPARPLLRVETARRTHELGVARDLPMTTLVEFLKRTFPGTPVIEKR